MNPEVPLPTPGSLGLLKKHVPSPTLAKDPASIVWPSSNIGSLTRSLSVWVSACACRKRLWAPWWSPAAPLSSGLSSACGCRFKSPLRCELRADKAGSCLRWRQLGGISPAEDTSRNRSPQCRQDREAGGRHPGAGAHPGQGRRLRAKLLPAPRSVWTQEEGFPDTSQWERMQPNSG